MADVHYQEPGWFTRKIFNPLIAGATRLGISVWGSRILQVRGRTSGVVRETPVNLLTHDAHRYLVAPRERRSGYATFVSRRRGPFVSAGEPKPSPPWSCRTPTSPWSFGRISAAGRWRSVCSSTASTPIHLTKKSRIAPNHPVFEIATAT